MKKILTISVLLITSSFAWADERDDIMERYQDVRAKAESACKDISDPIGNIMKMAGISTISSGVGTVAAGTATVAGMIKAKKDEDIIDWTKLLKMVQQADGKQLVAILTWIGDKAEEEQRNKAAEKLQADIDAAKKKSQTLGKVRTVGDFVAGGTSAISAGTAIGTVATVDFDELKKNMQNCMKYSREIQSLQTLLMGYDMNDPVIDEMGKIVDNCNGFDTKNIDTVKTTLTIAGVTSVVGTGTGIAGGIISNKAVKMEQNAGVYGANSGKDGGTKEYNTAANVLSGVTTATSLGSALLSGLPLIGLSKNAEIARDCSRAF